MSRWTATWIAAYVAAAFREQERWAREAHAFRPVVEPPMPVTVLVPTLNEVEYVVDCLRTLRRQAVLSRFPEAVEFLLVDSGSEDGTVEAARPYVDRVVHAPRGKISALDAGIRAARHPIIAEADADGDYPPYWLQELVRPFESPDVVGVHGPVRYPDSPFALRLAPSLIPVNAALGKLPGGARAYRRDAYFQCGGFNLRIVEEHLPTLWLEEEFSFPVRLRREGRVVWSPSAICFKSARRFDPVFVRERRARGYRESVEAGERFGVRGTPGPKPEATRVHRARRSRSRPRLPPRDPRSAP